MSEEQALIEYLRSGGSSQSFEDDLHNRIVGALGDSSASDLDRAVLLRQLLRRWSLRDGRDVPVELTDVFSESIRSSRHVSDSASFLTGCGSQGPGTRTGSTSTEAFLMQPPWRGQKRECAFMPSLCAPTPSLRRSPGSRAIERRDSAQRAGQS